jgi:hypothetical protein
MDQKDVKTEIHRPTEPVDQKITLRNLNSKQKENLQKLFIGAGGIASGAAIFALSGFANTDGSKAIDSKGKGNESVEVTIHTTAPFIDADDSLSFSKAFAESRATLGPGGFFEWRGETFNTYTKEEWDAMTPDQRHEFFESIDPAYTELYGNNPDEILKILNGETAVINDEDITDLVITEETDSYDENIDMKDAILLDDNDYVDDQNEPETYQNYPEHLPTDSPNENINPQEGIENSNFQTGNELD